MGHMTSTGELMIGLEVDGVVHKAFELRIPTVQDNIDAMSEVGTANGIELDLATMARCLVRLGTLTQRPWSPPGAKRDPKEPAWITTDLLRKLKALDYSVLDRAVADLQKKAVLGASNSPGGPSPEPSSPATGSAPSTSPG